MEGWDGWGMLGLISLESIRMDHSGQGWTSSCLDWLCLAVCGGVGPVVEDYPGWTGSRSDRSGFERIGKVMSSTSS